MNALKIQKVLAFALAVSMAFCLTGCETYDNFRKAFIDPPVEEEVTIKIGVFEPTTGRLSYDAEEELKGIEFAHKMFPSVNGYDIELVYQDNRSTPEEAITAAQNLVDSNVVAVIGSYSPSLSIAASDIFAAGKVAAITPTNQTPILTSSNEYYYRVCDTDEDLTAETAAEYLYSKFSTNVAVVYAWSKNATTSSLCFLEEENKENSANNENAQNLTNGVSSTALRYISSKEYFEPLYPKDTTKYDDFTSKMRKLTGDENYTPSLYYVPEDSENWDILLALLAEEIGSNGGIYFAECEFTEKNLNDLIAKSLSCSAVFLGEEISLDELGNETLDEEGLIQTISVYKKSEEEYVSYSFSFLSGENLKEEDPIASFLYISDTDDSTSSAISSDLYTEFKKACFKEYGKEKPELSQEFLLGFDAYYIVYNALCELDYIEYPEEENTSTEVVEEIESLYDPSGKQRCEVLNNLIKETENVQGLLRNYSFNNYGDPLRNAYILEKSLNQRETGETDEEGNVITENYVETELKALIHPNI